MRGRRLAMLSDMDAVKFADTASDGTYTPAGAAGGAAFMVCNVGVNKNAAAGSVTWPTLVARIPNPRSTHAANRGSSARLACCDGPKARPTAYDSSSAMHQAVVANTPTS
jgi:hypothetical protein